MKKYYVVNAILSSGFGGVICKAFTIKKEAEQELKHIKSQFPNITEMQIVEVQTDKGKEEAERMGNVIHKKPVFLNNSIC